VKRKGCQNQANVEASISETGQKRRRCVSNSQRLAGRSNGKPMGIESEYLVSLPTQDTKMAELVPFTQSPLNSESTHGDVSVDSSSPSKPLSHTFGMGTMLDGFDLPMLASPLPPSLVDIADHANTKSPQLRYPDTCHSESRAMHNLEDLSSAEGTHPVGRGKANSEGNQDEAIGYTPTTMRRRIIIRVPESWNTGPSRFLQDNTSPDSVKSLTPDLGRNQTAISEPALSLDNSASCGSSQDGSFWDLPHPYSTPDTLLSLPLDFNATVVNLEAENNYPSLQSTPSECNMPDLSDPAWKFDLGNLTFPVTSSSEDLDIPRSDTASTVTDPADSIDPVILFTAAEDMTAESQLANLKATDKPGPTQDEAYSVECLLERHGDWFYVKWSDGSCSWEPRDNILDDGLIQELKNEHRGLHLGVEIMRTRWTESGQVQYRVHWKGRPTAEDSWVAEKDLSDELVKMHKPKKKTKRRRRRN